MKLVRRAFYIEEGSDNKVKAISEVVKADKSELVDLLIVKGLERIEHSTVGEIAREIGERRLRLVDKGSIKSASVKRR